MTITLTPLDALTLRNALHTALDQTEPHTAKYVHLIDLLAHVDRTIEEQR